MITAKPPSRGKQTEPRKWQDTLEQLRQQYWAAETSNFEAATRAEMAAMADLTNGGTLRITGTYPSALKATLEKLKALQGKSALSQTRDAILEKLPAAFGLYEQAFEVLRWEGLPTLENLPEYETQPLTAEAKHIALYPDNQHGHNIDRFVCLCLALWYCNFHLELPIGLLDKVPQDVALFDAPPIQRTTNSTQDS
jgi:hypothetical protein